MRAPFAPILLALPLLAGGSGTVTVKGKKFTAEVAATGAEKERGLMQRANFPEDRCMVFLYDQDGHHPIWMKNCLIALDVVWVDAQGRIVEVVEKAPPCSPMLGDACPTYGGQVPARYFVEFAAGTVKRLGIRKGDPVSWELQVDRVGKVTLGAPAKPTKPAKAGKA